MKVWIAETGVYDDCEVEGVYATAEAAMKANPVPKASDFPDWYAFRPGGWTQVGEERWRNGLDWDLACTVYAMEVQE